MVDFLGLQTSVADLKMKVSKQSQEMKAMQKEFQTAQLETGKAAF